MKQKVIDELSTVSHVCTTADIWSAHNRSFFGVTAHWIHPASLTRRSAALACTHMPGRHTFTAIAEHLHSVHSSYCIVSKVVMTVTDNASNFVKAFSEYAQVVEVDDDDETVTVVDVDSVVSGTDVGNDDNEDAHDISVYLPPHQRCASHTLNLVAVSDTESANSDASYKRVNRATMAKCCGMWNKASRSTVCADIVRSKLKTSLVVPNDTRWNSHFRAVEKMKKVLEQHPGHVVSEVCQALDVVPFHANEICFINEYCTVMQPLASALDILQGETKCFIGYLLPTLTSLEMKLKALRPNLRLAAPLVDAILAGVAKRFAGYHDRHDLILASITLPQFRLRWLEESKRASCRSLLYEQAGTVSVALVQENTEPAASTSQEDDFFAFVSEPENAGSNTTDAEVDAFLSDPSKEMVVLHKYPHILKLFLKFNTPLPSSAPVERLFSLGGQIFVPRRNRLSNSHFERQLLLRANKGLF